MTNSPAYIAGSLLGIGVFLLLALLALGSLRNRLGKAWPWFYMAAIVVIVIAANRGFQMELHPKQADLPPELAALKQYYPDQYSTLLAQDHSATTSVAMQEAVETTIIKILADHIDQLNDDNVNKSTALKVAEIKAVRDQNPDVCIDLIFGIPMHVAANAVMPPDLIQKEHDLTTADLIQIATKPDTPATPLASDQATALIVNAFKALPSGEQAVAKPLIMASTLPSTIDEDQAVCDFYINLFTEALAGPPGTLKSMLAAFEKD